MHGFDGQLRERMLNIYTVLGRRFEKDHVSVLLAEVNALLRVYPTQALVCQVELVAQHQKRWCIRLVVLASAHEVLLPVGESNEALL